MSANAELFLSSILATAGEITDACVRCGACVEACPMVEPAGIDADDPAAIAGGVIDLMNGQPASLHADALRWAEVCTGSGKCIPACEHGVNPRLMIKLAKARVSTDADANLSREQARQGFRTMAKGVRALSRLQLDPDTLAKVHSNQRTEVHPDVVFYTGCNLLKTPHIALLCLDVLDRLGVRYEVMGGPSHCCGVYQINAGDLATAGRVGFSTIEKLSEPKTEEVLSWCPSCQTNLGEVTLPTYKKAMARDPFGLTPFIEFVHRHLDALAPHFVHRVEKRVALLERPAFPGIVDGARAILEAIPGLELVDLDVPRIGTMANSLAVLPEFKTALREREFAAAADARVDTYATLFHACHRDICHYEDDVSFEILNFMELVGEALGVRHPDLYKQLKKLNDVDRILAEMRDPIADNGFDVEKLREIVWVDMFGATPAPPR
ncbi:MAG: (Fe-S)-binding protein [Gammaproteobacteria bacterium]|nr:(Fe-S)-binding protein [Gammaproteobacteria bacterium]